MPLLNLNQEYTDPTGKKLYVSGATQQDVNAAITAQSLTPTTPIQVPPVPTDANNYQGLTAGGNAVVGANNLTLTPPAPTDTGTSDLEAMITALGQPPSASAQYGSDYAASGIPGLQTTANVDVAAVKASQARLAAINAQLAGITAEAQAIPIQQQKDAEGRGITAAGLAPITTAALRNNALRALPLQAQALGVQAEVAAAQGNAELSQSILQQAQDHLDKVFQIHSTDATNQYNYRKDVLGKIYDSLTAKEKVRADALQKQRDQDFTSMTNNLNNAQALAKMAIENGQGALAAKISALDPKSQTYTKDLASLQGQIRPKATAGDNAPTVKTINGVDMQWNPASGKWGAISGGIGGVADPAKAKEQVNLVLNSVKNAENLSGVSGRSGLRKTFEGILVGSTKYTNLVAETNTLRTNVLTMMTDPAIKKFFGPQMSNADVQLMTSAGTTLNPELQSPTKMREELKRLKDLAQRAKLSLDGITQFGLTGSGVRVGMTPDGRIVDVDGNMYDKNGNKI